jgi:hypothetical protein
MNVREIWRDNEEWTILRHGQPWAQYEHTTQKT